MFNLLLVALILDSLGIMMQTVVAFRENHTKIGNIPDEHVLSFQISLPLKNQTELDKFLIDLYNPKHENFRKYIEPHEFYERFSPSEQEIELLKKKLEGEGITVDSVRPNRFLIDVRAPASNINKFLQTNIVMFQNTFNGQIFHAPEVNLQYPYGILYVHGLDNSTRHFRSSVTRIGRTRNLVNDFLSASNIRTAYGIGSTYTGTGQTVALVEFDNYVDSDITYYASSNKLATPTISRVYISSSCQEACSSTACTPINCGQSPPTSPTSNSGQTEVTLDIDMVLAVAPSAQIKVYIGANTGGFDVISKIASDNLAKVVSSSWGIAEDTVANGYFITGNQIYSQMAAQGQTMFAATGDYGAFGNPKYPSTLVVEDPSTQPYVTAVGGTSLTVDPTTSSYVSETTWYDASSSSGGGGGISAYWSIPSYQSQSGVVSSASLGSLSKRNVPDVSLNADPNNDAYFIYMTLSSGANWYGVGGTSAAAPLWAGFITQINDYRSNKLGQAVLGFINNDLYTLGIGSEYGYAFHDIADGSTNGKYPAVTGYDLATGWGTIKSALFYGLGGCTTGYGFIDGACNVTPSPTTAKPTTGKPSASPTGSPPTRSPTRKPTSKSPTTSPTRKPTTKPSSSPTKKPSKAPTKQPTTQSPSNIPTTSLPSMAPITKAPTTNSPSRSPTKKPVSTHPPSLGPRLKHPTLRPTKAPTSKSPTVSPISSSPTKSPSFSSPSLSPSRSPTPPTTFSPTYSPSYNPTKSPTPPTTFAPSSSPIISNAPTIFPTPVHRYPVDPEDETAWKMFRSAFPDTTYCDIPGVSPCETCSNPIATKQIVCETVSSTNGFGYESHIVEIYLENAKLSGILTASMVTAFPYLRLLDLGNNGTQDANEISSDSCFEMTTCTSRNIDCSFPSSFQICQVSSLNVGVIAGTSIGGVIAALSVLLLIKRYKDKSILGNHGESNEERKGELAVQNPKPQDTVPVANSEII